MEGACISCLTWNACSIIANEAGPWLSMAMHMALRPASMSRSTWSLQLQGHFITPYSGTLKRRLGLPSSPSPLLPSRPSSDSSTRMALPGRSSCGGRGQWGPLSVQNWPAEVTTHSQMPRVCRGRGEWLHLQIQEGSRHGSPWPLLVSISSLQGKLLSILRSSLLV